MSDEIVFNYRRFGARRIVENAFGIMCSRFRLLLGTLQLDVSNAMQVVSARIIWHNFLSMNKDRVYSSSGFIEVDDEAGNTTRDS